MITRYLSCTRGIFSYNLNLIILCQLKFSLKACIVNLIQTNPSQQVLDLTDYACRKLLVSFAVINRAGLSNFSAPQMIFVEGGKQQSLLIINVLIKIIGRFRLPSHQNEFLTLLQLKEIFMLQTWYKRKAYIWEKPRQTSVSIPFQAQLPQSSKRENLKGAYRSTRAI